MSQKIQASGRLAAGLRSLARPVTRALRPILRALLVGFAALGPGVPPPPPTTPQRIEARAENGEDDDP